MQTDKYELKKRKYKCNICGKIVERYSDKQWIKSDCGKMEKDGRLILVKDKKENVCR